MRARLLAAAVCSIAATACAAMASPASRARGVPIDFATETFSFTSLDVSPDGQSIVFDMLGDLYVVATRGGRARRLLSGSAYERQPRWSPDGRSIAFVSDRSGSDNVWTLRIAGGGLTQISRQPRFGVRPFAKPVWTADGGGIVVATADHYPSPSRNLPLRLERYAADGTTIEPVMPDQRATDPFAAADGKALYFSRSLEPLPVVAWTGQDTVLPGWQVARLDLSSGMVSTITDDPNGAVSPTLSRDGRWLAYVSRRDGVSTLRLRDLIAGTDRLLDTLPDRDQRETKLGDGLAPGYAFTPDSRALIVTARGRFTRIDVLSGSATVIPVSARFSARIANRREPGHLKAVADTRRVTVIRRPALSPDRRTWAFAALNRIWLLPVAGGAPRRLTTDETTLVERDPAWSADGTQIVYATTDAMGGGTLVVAAIDRGGATLAAAQAHYSSPALSADGRSLTAIRRRAGDGSDVAAAAEIVTIDLAGQAPPQSVAIGDAADPDAGAGRDGSDVLFYDGRRLWSRPARGSAMPLIEPHFRTDPAAERERYGGNMAAYSVRVSPDRRAALIRYDWQTYLVEFAQTVGALAGRAFSLWQPPADIRVRPVDAAGVVDAAWSGNDTIVYSLGPTIHRQDRRTGAGVVTPVAMTLAKPDHPGVTLIRDARIETFGPAGTIAHGDVLVVGRTIRAVGPAGAVPPPTGRYRTIDGRGLTVLPGFVDTHCHADMPEPNWALRTYIAYGVTTCFDPAGSIDQLSQRLLIAAARIVGPRLFSVTRPVEWWERIASAADARRPVDRLALFDADGVKEYLSGSRPVRSWLARAAGDAGLMTFWEGNTISHNAANILDGQTAAAHFLTTPDLYDDYVRLLAATGTSVHIQFLTLRAEGAPSALSYFIQTKDPLNDARIGRLFPRAYLDARVRRYFAVAPGEQAFATYGRTVKRLVTAGIKVGLGAHGEFHGAGYLWEIEALAAGAGARTALRVATIEGARTLNLDAQIGSIEPGKIADLVIVRGSPADDIGDLHNTVNVMKEGRLHDADGTPVPDRGTPGADRDEE